MKGKKWLTIITACVSVIAIVIAIVIGSNSNNIAYDLAMAIFGSALLGFIMSLTEYFVERRNAMEAFWEEAQKVLKNLRRVKYIDLDAPVDLIHDCFCEEHNSELRKIFSPTEQDEAKHSLISYYESNIPMTWDECDDIEKELENLYERKMQGYREEYIKGIISYVEASTTDLGALGNAYGNLDFLFANKRIRMIAYSGIYERLVMIHKQLLEESYHFSSLLNGKGSLPVCAKKADALCSELFDVQYKEENGYKTKVVFQKVFDDIGDELERFRCKIYYSKELELKERVPVLGNVSAIEFDKNSPKEDL